MYGKALSPFDNFTTAPCQNELWITSSYNPPSLWNMYEVWTANSSPKTKEFWKLERIQIWTEPKQHKLLFELWSTKEKHPDIFTKAYCIWYPLKYAWFMICKHIRPKHNSFGSSRMSWKIISCDINSLLWIKEMCAVRLKCMGYELLIATIRSKQKKQPSLRM